MHHKNPNDESAQLQKTVFFPECGDLRQNRYYTARIGTKKHGYEQSVAGTGI